MKVTTDIDVDVANREVALESFEHYSASIRRNDGTMVKHSSGVYFTEIPHDHNNQATLDYKDAEERGYFKIDLLNVSVYEKVKSEEHLLHLMLTEPPWEKLLEAEFCKQLIHIGEYHSTIVKLPEPIDSIPRLMMFISMIRPAKKHLIGKPWAEVAKTIWDKPTDGSYAFKRAHACSYAHLIVVHMNLINEA